jgi:hypothetical protein
MDQEVLQDTMVVQVKMDVWVHQVHVVVMAALDQEVQLVQLVHVDMMVVQVKMGVWVQ